MGNHILDFYGQPSFKFEDIEGYFECRYCFESTKEAKYSPIDKFVVWNCANEACKRENTVEGYNV